MRRNISPWHYSITVLEASCMGEPRQGQSHPPKQIEPKHITDEAKLPLSGEFHVIFES